MRTLESSILLESYTPGTYTGIVRMIPGTRIIAGITCSLQGTTLKNAKYGCSEIPATMSIIKKRSTNYLVPTILSTTIKSVQVSPPVPMSGAVPSNSRPLAYACRESGIPPNSVSYDVYLVRRYPGVRSYEVYRSTYMP